MRASPKNPLSLKFLNVCSAIVYSFVKNAPKIQECWLAPVSLRGLTVKGVYEVSYNRYGQIIVRVCMYRLNMKPPGIFFVTFLYRGPTGAGWEGEELL